MKKALLTGKTKELKLQPVFSKLQEELSLLHIDSFIVNPSEEVTQDFDIVFSVGGDGSFISAARKYIYSQKPVVAIKGGNIGFLTNIDPADFKQTLPVICSSEYQWTKRMLITGETQNSKKIVALNEFLFSNSKKGSLCDFTIYINNDSAMNVRADGVLFSTPTGSTAYNLSSGGPIVLPDMELVAITLVCSHILGERPLIIGLDNKIQIVNEGSSISKIWSDGQESMDFNQGDIFTVGKPLYINSLHTSSHDFFTTLSDKLGWKKNIR